MRWYVHTSVPVDSSGLGEALRAELLPSLRSHGLIPHARPDEPPVDADRRARIFAAHAALGGDVEAVLAHAEKAIVALAAMAPPGLVLASIYGTTETGQLACSVEPAPALESVT